MPMASRVVRGKGVEWDLRVRMKSKKAQPRKLVQVVIVTLAGCHLARRVTTWDCDDTTIGRRGW